MKEFLALAAHYNLAAPILWQAFWIWRADANQRQLPAEAVPEGVALRAALLLAVKLRDSDFLEPIRLVQFGQPTLSRKALRAAERELYAHEERLFDAAVSEGAVETPYDLVRAQSLRLHLPAEAVPYLHVCAEIVLFDAGLRAHLHDLDATVEAIVHVAQCWFTLAQNSKQESQTSERANGCDRDRLLPLAQLIVQSAEQNQRIILYKYAALQLPDFAQLRSLLQLIEN